MTQPGFVFDYLTKCRYESSHTLSPGEDCLQGILQAVVIPVLAERGHLFSTLASLAGNAPDKLERTLVICVVNNRPCPYTSAEAIENNQRTLEILRELGRGRLPPFEEGGGFLIEDCRRILQGRLRLAYVDASSPGRELPLKQGGVGLARKIGLDAALCVMDFTGSDPGLLLCLDADSPVDRNYLSAVRRFYEGRKPGAAVVPYAHPLPANPKLLAAIVRYELYLRYYVLGLKFAGSPYAFHTIGSTMSCSVRSYAAVRGMNRREAGEDFYFLNKLAKHSPVGTISGTQVYPSPRVSRRVPFGTGQRMNSSLEGTDREDIFYDPRAFRVLKSWLKGMTTCIGNGGDFTLRMAEEISPLLPSFLERNQFPHVWTKICRTHRSPEKRLEHFSEWFDGFRTMKFLHHLSDTAYPACTMGRALPLLLESMEHPLEEVWRAKRDGSDPGLDVQIEMLNNLRHYEFQGEK
ncbi:hypothetical protein ACJ77P_08025 [Syntrophus buswellii]|uniref:hypothetical protein n=1 Tax=Syntrophus buswellii TaxID=43774 RepID=UPI0038D3E6A9